MISKYCIQVLIVLLILSLPLRSFAIDTSLDDPYGVVSGISSDPEVYILQISSDYDAQNFGSVQLRNSKNEDVLAGEFIPPNKYYFRGISDGKWILDIEQAPQKIEKPTTKQTVSSVSSSSSSVKEILVDQE